MPNLLAGGLASNRSRLVAVLVPEVAQSIFNDTIQAMSMELSLDGYIVMLGLTGADNSRMPQLVDAALARRADGVILTGIVSDPATRDRLLQRDTTVIETWGIPENPGGHRRRLLAHGGRSRRRAVPARPRLHPTRCSPWPPARARRQRRDGFIDEWRVAGREAPAVIEVPLLTRFSHSRLVWRHLSQLNPQPDVIVCGSDLLAQGVIVEAMSAGVKVPEQLAVVGFGNLAIAGDMRPSLTTIDVDGARIGRETVAVLRRVAPRARRSPTR